MSVVKQLLVALQCSRTVQLMGHTEQLPTPQECSILGSLCILSNLGGRDITLHLLNNPSFPLRC